MAITFYDLCGRDQLRFSPYGWRTRMALAHKGLEASAEVELVRFSDKHKLEFSKQQLVPVIEDGDTVVNDSWQIACYLEDAYPDAPSLFGGDSGKAVTRFISHWTDRVVNAGIAPLIIADILDHVHDDCAAYFRTTREKRFGRTLEEVQGERDEKVVGFRNALAPARATLEGQSFLGGDAPMMADYILFASFQWARISSEFKVLENDDPLYAWRDRMLDLYGGMPRQQGYDV